MALGAGASLLSGAVAANKAKKQAKSAGDRARIAQAEINAIKANRVPITNPYASTSDLSGLAEDLSSMISNPFANLGVATQAAEIQMEQSNLALSNALDTLATTGASAGGATALAQAALASKKGVSASISEGQRGQGAQAAGDQFVMQMNEARSNQDLGYAAGKEQAALQAQANARAAQGQAWGSAISGAIGFAGQVGTANIAQGRKFGGGKIT